ncbi:MAG: SPOR domain-containing protein [Candidatus Alcyoniella australis]|nr:SPOR domain-containing protein [Candidatus Alcyoniella australis]
MRDLRKIRDKVEIKLDNRQIAAIFLSSLVLLAIVFYLGVKVGSRLEQVRRVPTPRPELTTRGVAAITPTPWEQIEPAATPEPTPTPEAAQTPKIISSTELDPSNVTDEVGGIRYTFDGPGGTEPPPTVEPTPEITPADAATPEVAATPAPTPEAAPTPYSPPMHAGNWTVQVASFQERGQADADVLKLKNHGWPAYVVRAEISGKGIYYRVRVGQFEDQDGAEKMREAIAQAEGRNAFVTRIN